MTEVSKVLEHRAFNEREYLELNPDIRAAVDSGELQLLWEHYDRHGRGEGRLPCRFDEKFYRRAYPQVAEDLRMGLASTALQHYILYGVGRGYLPHLEAVRPESPSACHSNFGGLWIDAGDAEAKIRGRVEIGLISEDHAAQLRFFSTNDYLIIENAIADEILDAALTDFDKAYRGKIPDLHFECHGVASSHITWQEEINQFPAKASISTIFRGLSER